MEGVTGSIPVAPTIRVKLLNYLCFVIRLEELRGFFPSVGPSQTRVVVHFSSTMRTVRMGADGSPKFGPHIKFGSHIKSTSAGSNLGPSLTAA
jgi:hypothetical protein